MQLRRSKRIQGATQVVCTQPYIWDRLGRVWRQSGKCPFRLTLVRRAASFDRACIAALGRAFRSDPAMHRLDLPRGSPGIATLNSDHRVAARVDAISGCAVGYALMRQLCD